MLLLHGIVPGEQTPAFKPLDLFSTLQLGDNPVYALILIGGFLAGPADNQRCTRFIDQDGIHFVHNAEVVPALHAVFQVKLHVVAQIIEAEFVVGAVGNVGGIGAAALVVIEIVHDHTHRKTKEGI